MKALLRRHTSRIAAIAIVVAVVAWITGAPSYSSTELAQMASNYSFSKHALMSASNREPRQQYPVEQPLAHFRAYASVIGAAVGLADADGDGVDNDVCLVDPRYVSATVQPAPGTSARYKPFQLDPRPQVRFDDTMSPSGCTPGDFNEDGATDFLVYYVGRTPVLFMRRPGTRLGPNAFARQRLTADQRWVSDTVTQTDIDGDGHVDLLVGNYFGDGSHYLDPRVKHDSYLHMPDSYGRANNGGGMRIFLWRSARRGASPAAHFEEAKDVLPEPVAHGWTVAIGAADLSGDDLPDVYVANDLGPDHLFVNESTPGNVKLTEVKGKRSLGTPSSKVLGTDSFKGMSAAIADLTGDGRLDIFVSNITSRFALQESNFVWVNTGKRMAAGEPAPFEDKSEELAMARSGWGWDAKAGDFDADGTPEVVQAVGLLKGHRNRWPEIQELAMGQDQLVRQAGVWPRLKLGDDLAGHETDAFWARGPAGRWANIGRRVGLDKPMVSRGIALGDVNRDGRLDFAIANQWEDSFLFLNRAKARPFLGLQLLLPAAGKTSTTHELPSARGVAARPAIGATATVHMPDGKRQVQIVDGGNGHAGFSARDLFFGLGDNPPQRLTVDLVWRDGNGNTHRDSVQLRPGWHTVLLEQR